MSKLNTTAERLLRIADEDSDSNHWSWAVICIGAGGARHNGAEGVVVYRFEDKSAIEVVKVGDKAHEKPVAFDGTFTNGYAFRK